MSKVLKVDARSFRETGGYVGVYERDMTDVEKAQRAVDKKMAAQEIGLSEQRALREERKDKLFDLILAKGLITEEEIDAFSR